MGRHPAGEQALPRQPRSVKGIDGRLWIRLRAMALLEGKTTGEAVNDAIREYLEKRGVSVEVADRG